MISGAMTSCRPRVCSATDYPVAERLMYPLTDRRENAILRSCPGPAVTTCSLIG